MLLPIVTESTRGLGFLDGHLQILSFPGSLCLSQTLLPNFLKAHVILLASTVSPLLYYLTCPTMLLSADLLLQRTHSDHLRASTVPFPLVLDGLVA